RGVEDQEEAREFPSPPPKASASDTTPERRPLVKIAFATDRLPSGAKGPRNFFGVEWNKTGDHLTTAFLEVSIPAMHHVEGHVERPWKFFKWEGKEDPANHVVITNLKQMPSDAFYAELRNEFANRVETERSALVFIHGFNVTFDDAAYRTAQLT